MLSNIYIYLEKFTYLKKIVWKNIEDDKGNTNNAKGITVLEDENQGQISLHITQKTEFTAGLWM